MGRFNICSICYELEEKGVLTELPCSACNSKWRRKIKRFYKVYRRELKRRESDIEKKIKLLVRSMRGDRNVSLNY